MGSKQLLSSNLLKSIAFFLSLSLTLSNTFYAYAESPRGLDRVSRFPSDNNTQGTLQHPQGVVDEAPRQISPKNLAELVLPAELGTIQETHQAPSTKCQASRENSAHGARCAAPVVFYVQDAHTLYEAQKSIQGIIGYFQKQTGLKLIALEGGAGKLDPFLFRNYPDPSALKQVFERYLERGELSGAVAAAVLNEQEANYYGIEDKALYEEGILAFLEAERIKPELLRKIRHFQNELNAQKQKVYPRPLLDLDRALKTFQDQNTDLTPLLQKLPSLHGAFIRHCEEHQRRSNLKTGIASGTRGSAALEDVSCPRNDISAYPHLNVLMQEIAQEDSPSQDEVRHQLQTLANELKPHLENREELMVFNEKNQAYQTSSLDPKAFSHFLLEQARAHGINQEKCARLKKFSENYPLLAQIQAPVLFKELEAYIQEVKSSLFPNEAARRLDQEDNRLRLLARLARLELTQEEWEKLQRDVLQPLRRQEPVIARARSARSNPEEIAPQGLSRSYGINSTNGIASASMGSLPRNDELDPFIRFYELAVQREKALSRNLSKLIEDKKSPQTLFLSGGFHTQGITEALKREGISYVLIAPRITQMPEENTYLRIMRGDVSWKDYFRVRRGKVNLYDAFTRATVDRLMDVVNGGSGIVNRFTIHDPPLLKTWRDDIIRKLASQEKIAKASDYTHFIEDAALKSVSSEELASLQAQWQARIDDFINGLKRLVTQNQLNEKNLAQLLSQRTSMPAANLPLIPGRFRAEVFGLGSPPPLRSEARSAITLSAEEEELGYEAAGGMPWYASIAMTLEHEFKGNYNGISGLELGSSWRSPNLRDYLVGHGARMSRVGYENPKGSQDILDYLVTNDQQFNFAYAPGVLSTESEDPQKYPPNTLEKLILIYAGLHERLEEGGLLTVTLKKEEVHKGQAPPLGQIQELGFEPIDFHSRIVSEAWPSLTTWVLKKRDRGTSPFARKIFWQLQGIKELSRTEAQKEANDLGEYEIDQLEQVTELVKTIRTALPAAFWDEITGLEPNHIAKSSVILVDLQKNGLHRLLLSDFFDERGLPFIAKSLQRTLLHFSEQIGRERHSGTVKVTMQSRLEGMAADFYITFQPPAKSDPRAEARRISSGVDSATVFSKNYGSLAIYRDTGRKIQRAEVRKRKFGSADGKFSEADTGVLDDRNRRDNFGLEVGLKKDIQPLVDQRGSRIPHAKQDNTRALGLAEVKDRRETEVQRKENPSFTRPAGQNIAIRSFRKANLPHMDRVKTEASEPTRRSLRDRHVQEEPHQEALGGNGKGLFSRQESPVLNGRSDVFRGQIGVIRENRIGRLSSGKEVENQMYGDSQPANERLSGEKIRVDSDSIKFLAHSHLKSTTASMDRQLTRPFLRAEARRIPATLDSAVAFSENRGSLADDRDAERKIQRAEVRRADPEKSIRGGNASVRDGGRANQGRRQKQSLRQKSPTRGIPLRAHSFSLPLPHRSTHKRSRYNPSKIIHPTTKTDKAKPFGLRIFPAIKVAASTVTNPTSTLPVFSLCLGVALNIVKIVTSIWFRTKLKFAPEVIPGLSREPVGLPGEPPHPKGMPRAEVHPVPTAPGTPQSSRRSDARAEVRGVTQSVPPFNPGYGSRKWRDLFKERQKLEAVLKSKGLRLGIGFVNLWHAPPLDPDHIAGFTQADFHTYELPQPTVRDFLQGKPARITHGNPFWARFLQRSRELLGQGKAQGVFGVSNFPASRNALYRTVFYYTSADFTSKPRDKILVVADDLPAHWPDDFKEGVLPEGKVLGRLSPAEREEFRKNRLLFLHQGEPNPLSDTKEPLPRDIVLYRQPHVSIQKLMEELQDKYKDRLPGLSLREFIAWHYLRPIIELRRDLAQLEIMFHKIRGALEAGGAVGNKEIFSLHLGGALHYQNLIQLATRDLSSASSPLSFQSVDDPRYPFFGGNIKGSSFFAARFEEILDHARIADGDFEVDMPYFAGLFGEFLKSEERFVRMEKIHQTIFRTMSAPGVFSVYRLPLAKHRMPSFFWDVLDSLTDEDLRDLEKTVSIAGGDLRFLFIKLRQYFEGPAYKATPRTEALRREIRVMRHFMNGFEAMEQNKFDEAAVSFEEAHTLNDRDPDALFGLGMARALGGRAEQAGIAFRKMLALAPEFFQWNFHADSWKDFPLSSAGTAELTSQPRAEVRTTIRSEPPKSHGFGIKADLMAAHKLHLPNRKTIYPSSGVDAEMIARALKDFPDLDTFVLVDPVFGKGAYGSEVIPYVFRIALAQQLARQGFMIGGGDLEKLVTGQFDANGRLEFEARVPRSLFKILSRQWRRALLGKRTVRLILYARDYLNLDARLIREDAPQGFGLTLVKNPGLGGMLFLKEGGGGEDRFHAKEAGRNEFDKRVMEETAVGGLIYIQQDYFPDTKFVKQYGLQTLDHSPSAKDLVDKWQNAQAVESRLGENQHVLLMRTAPRAEVRSGPDNFLGVIQENLSSMGFDLEEMLRVLGPRVDSIWTGKESLEDKERKAFKQAFKRLWLIRDVYEYNLRRYTWLPIDEEAKKRHAQTALEKLRFHAPLLKREYEDLNFQTVLQKLLGGDKGLLTKATELEEHLEKAREALARLEAASGTEGETLPLEGSLNMAYLVEHTKSALEWLVSNAPGYSKAYTQGYGTDPSEVSWVLRDKVEEVMRFIGDIDRKLFIPEPVYEPDVYFPGEMHPDLDSENTDPILIALNLILLNLKGDEKVLEIGTGRGYQDAILARFLSQGHLYAVEQEEGTLKKAKANLSELGVSNVSLYHRDGQGGYPGLAQEVGGFDVIVVSGAIPYATVHSLKNQLKIGGRLVTGVLKDPANLKSQDFTLFIKTDEGQLLEMPAEEGVDYFVPLKGAVDRRAEVHPARLGPGTPHSKAVPRSGWPLRRQSSRRSDARAEVRSKDSDIENARPKNRIAATSANAEALLKEILEGARMRPKGFYPVYQKALRISYLEGMNRQTVAKQFGWTKNSVKRIIQEAVKALAASLAPSGITRETVWSTLKSLKKQARENRVRELFRDYGIWLTAYERWLKSPAEIPPPLTFHHQTEEERESLNRFFQELEIPFPSVDQGRIVPRFNPRYGFLLQIKNRTNRLLHRYLVADREGRKFQAPRPGTPDEKLSRLRGPTGALSRLIAGYGPEDLLLAFSPRRVGPGRVLSQLLRESGSARAVPLPSGYQGKTVLVDMTAENLRAAQEPKVVLLLNEENRRPIVKVKIERANGRWTVFETDWVGIYSDWNRRSARVKAVHDAIMYLRKQRKYPPRLGVLKVRKSEPYPYKFISFGAPPPYLGKVFPYREVTPRLFEIPSGERFLGLWVPRADIYRNVPLKVFRTKREGKGLEEVTFPESFRRAEVRSGGTIIRLPSREDLMTLAKKEDIVVLGPSEKAKVLAMLRGAELSSINENWFETENITRGYHGSPSSLKRLAQNHQLTLEEFKSHFGLPQDVRSIIVLNREGEHDADTLREEIFHALEGDTASDPTWQHTDLLFSWALEVVNDFIQLMFYPIEDVMKFQSSYTIWTDVVRQGLIERYRDTPNRDPNFEMKEILTALADDIKNNRKIKLNNEEVEIKDLFIRLDIDRQFLSDYLDILLKHERFSIHRPLFPSLAQDFAPRVEVPSARAELRTPQSLRRSDARAEVRVVRFLIDGKYEIVIKQGDLTQEKAEGAIVPINTAFAIGGSSASALGVVFQAELQAGGPRAGDPAKWEQYIYKVLFPSLNLKNPINLFDLLERRVIPDFGARPKVARKGTALVSKSIPEAGIKLEQGWDRIIAAFTRHQGEEGNLEKTIPAATQAALDAAEKNKLASVVTVPFGAGGVEGVRRAKEAAFLMIPVLLQYLREKKPEYLKKITFIMNDKRQYEKFAQATRKSLRAEVRSGPIGPSTPPYLGRLAPRAEVRKKERVQSKKPGVPRVFDPDVKQMRAAIEDYNGDLGSIAQAFHSSKATVSRRIHELRLAQFAASKRIQPRSKKQEAGFLLVTLPGLSKEEVLVKLSKVKSNLRRLYRALRPAGSDSWPEFNYLGHLEIAHGLDIQTEYLRIVMDRVVTKRSLSQAASSLGMDRMNLKRLLAALEKTAPESLFPEIQQFIVKKTSEDLTPLVKWYYEGEVLSPGTTFGWRVDRNKIAEVKDGDRRIRLSFVFSRKVKPNDSLEVRVEADPLLGTVVRFYKESSILMTLARFANKPQAIRVNEWNRLFIGSPQVFSQKQEILRKLVSSLKQEDLLSDYQERILSALIETPFDDQMAIARRLGVSQWSVWKHYSAVIQRVHSAIDRNPTRYRILHLPFQELEKDTIDTTKEEVTRPSAETASPPMRNALPSLKSLVAAMRLSGLRKDARFLDFAERIVSRLKEKGEADEEFVESASRNFEAALDQFDRKDLNSGDSNRVRALRKGFNSLGPARAEVRNEKNPTVLWWNFVSQRPLPEIEVPAVKERWGFQDEAAVRALALDLPGGDQIRIGEPKRGEILQIMIQKRAERSPDNLFEVELRLGWMGGKKEEQILEISEVRTHRKFLQNDWDGRAPPSKTEQRLEAMRVRREFLQSRLIPTLVRRFGAVLLDKRVLQDAFRSTGALDDKPLVLPDDVAVEEIEIHGFGRHPAFLYNPRAEVRSSSSGIHSLKDLLGQGGIRVIESELESENIFVEQVPQKRLPVARSKKELQKIRKINRTMKKAVRGMKPPKSERGFFGPYLPSPAGRVIRALKMLGIQKGDLVFDAGHGEGHVVFSVAGALGVKAVGAEHNPYRYRKSKTAEKALRQKKYLAKGQVKLIRRDFLKLSWKKFNFVYFYSFGALPEPTAIEDKLIRELAPGSRFILLGVRAKKFPETHAKKFYETHYENFSTLLKSGEFVLERFPSLGVWVFTKIASRAEVRRAGWPGTPPSSRRLGARAEVRRFEIKDSLELHRGFRPPEDTRIHQRSQTTAGIGDRLELPRRFAYPGSSSRGERDVLDFETAGLSVYPSSFGWEKGVFDNSGESFRRQKPSTERREKTFKRPITNDAAPLFVSNGRALHSLPAPRPEVRLTEVDSGPSFKEERKAQHLPDLRGRELTQGLRNRFGNLSLNRRAHIESNDNTSPFFKQLSRRAEVRSGPIGASAEARRIPAALDSAVVFSENRGSFADYRGAERKIQRAEVRKEKAKVKSEKEKVTALSRAGAGKEGRPSDYVSSADQVKIDQAASGISRIWRTREEPTTSFLESLIGAARLGTDGIDELGRRLHELLEEELIPEAIRERLGVQPAFASEAVRNLPPAWQREFAKRRIPAAIDPTLRRNFVISTRSVTADSIVRFIQEVLIPLGVSGRVAVVYEKEEERLLIKRALENQESKIETAYYRSKEERGKKLSEAYQQLPRGGAVMVAPSIDDFSSLVPKHQRLVLQESLIESGAAALAIDILTQMALPLAEIPKDLEPDEIEREISRLISVWSQKGFQGVRFQDAIILDLKLYLEYVADQAEAELQPKSSA